MSAPHVDYHHILVTKFPLNTVEVEVQVKGFVATVTSTLQYTNNEEEECPVEVIFVFSLPAEEAVCHFSSKICGEEVVAELHERVRAWELYDDAISSGQRAYIVQETEESPDVFSMVVGCLPPKESVFVTLVYVTELTVDADHGLRFCLPAVLNPRYTPSDMDLSRVTEMTAVSESLAACSLSLHIHITSPIAVSKVESNCSLNPPIYFNADHTEAEVSLSPGHRFDRDVEILLYYQNAHQPTAIVEAGCKHAQPGSLMADSVVMINLYPQFPPEMASSIGQRGEFIFLVDQSGSMAGSSIASARETLLLMLKSLPLGCYFNIYGFGSDFHFFFPTSVEYTQKTMEQAMKNVAVLRADRGGTEFLRPMEHIYCQDSLSDHPRQVFVITDGSVWNVKEILDLVRMHSRYHRCFTFGIGQGACTALVQGMAKEGGGIAQFIMSNERLQLKVMQSLSLAFLPFVSDVSVKWTVPDGIYVTDLIPPPNGLLQGQRALLYAQMSGKSSGGDEGTVTVQYRLGEQPVTNQLYFSLKPAEDTGLGIHRLAARALIQSLEMEEKKTYAREKATIDQSLRDKVVDLSVQSGVSSTFTAFLVVHKGSGHPVTGPMVDKRRPYNLRDFTLADATHKPKVTRFNAKPELERYKPPALDCSVKELWDCPVSEVTYGRCHTYNRFNCSVLCCLTRSGSMLCSPASPPAAFGLPSDPPHIPLTLAKGFEPPLNFIFGYTATGLPRVLGNANLPSSRLRLHIYELYSTLRLPFPPLRQNSLGVPATCSETMASLTQLKREKPVCRCKDPLRSNAMTSQPSISDAPCWSAAAGLSPVQRSGHSTRSTLRIIPPLPSSSHSFPIVAAAVLLQTLILTLLLMCFSQPQASSLYSLFRCCCGLSYQTLLRAALLLTLYSF
ncbi:von Willebrand factor A domain-containing protein 5A-like [Hoplias malabaricus]|uniref:von Willebrand factor A domain-containing protein 5A-like n=1 Tax=Hoplias malabaricus TaxID=27720 RepID=UPI003461E78F